MTTYLSRLVLNPRSREVRRDVADCHRLHQRIMSAFPDGAELGRSALEVLFRLEEGRSGASLLVQSGAEPDWGKLPADYVVSDWFGGDATAVRALDEVFEGLRVGQHLRFRLRANATRTIDTKSAPDGTKRNGRRVPLRTSEAREAWLRRKAAAGGFEVDEVAPAMLGVAESGGQVVHGWRGAAGPGSRQRLTVEGVDFDGRLRVVEPALFMAALRAGIGPGKAYGFGLLSIAPAGGG